MENQHTVIIFHDETSIFTNKEPLYFMNDDNFIYYESPLLELDLLIGKLLNEKGFPKISKLNLQNKISQMLFFLKNLYKVNRIKTDTIKLTSEYVYKNTIEDIDDIEEDKKQFFLHLINIYLNIYYISLEMIFKSEFYKDITEMEKENMKDEWKQLVFYKD
jgi:hypothetical protein